MNTPEGIISEKFQHKINNQIFQFWVIIDNNMILVSIKKLNPDIKYEKSFTKEDLYYFGKDDPFNKLISLLKNNQFKLKNKDNKIILKFIKENECTSFTINIPIISENYDSQNNVNESNIKDILNSEIKTLNEEELNKLKNQLSNLEMKIIYIKNKIEKKDVYNETILNSKILVKKDIKIIENFINPNDYNEFKLLFSTYKSIDDSIENMHKFCDNKGPTIIIIKANGKIFGGYNSSNWDKSGEYIKPDLKSKNCFLFSLDKKEKYTLQDENYSCLGSKSFILFGQSDLCIWNNYKKKEISFSEKSSYNIPDNFEMTGGKKNFKVDGFEVYSVK